jgi:hypothetical protein
MREYGPLALCTIAYYLTGVHCRASLLHACQYVSPCAHLLHVLSGYPIELFREEGPSADWNTQKIRRGFEQAGSP